MKAVTLIGIAALVPCIAHAQVNTGHSLEWYAARPQERAQTQLRCLADVKHLANTPDCKNALKADEQEAMKNRRPGFGEMNPNKPAFFTEDPHNRYNTLLICRNTPSFAGCDVARQSLLMQAGKAQ
jgi:hypothetical protein